MDYHFPHGHKEELAGFVSKEISLVDAISHTEVRNILLKHGIKYRQSKITLDTAEIRISFEKKRIEERRYSNLSSTEDRSTRMGKDR